MLSRVLILAGLVWSAACNSSADQGVFNQPSKSQSKPEAINLPANQAGALAVQMAAPTPAVTVNYLIQVTSKSGAKLCDGLATVQILSNFTMKFPDASLKCVSLTIDLAGILGSQDLTQGLDKAGNLSSDGQVLSVGSIAGATFTPPRPFLLGPVIQDVKIYEGFRKEYPQVLTTTDPKTGKAITSQGQFTIEVLAADTPYANNYIGDVFKHTLHWQMTTTGFAGISTKTGLIFKRWEWVWNIRPIMIPKLVIVGTIADFISSDGPSSGSEFVGEVTISLIAQSYQLN